MLTRVRTCVCWVVYLCVPPVLIAQPDAEYELVQAQDTHAQALARMDRARREQEATDAAGYDQPDEDSTLTR